MKYRNFVGLASHLLIFPINHVEPSDLWGEYDDPEEISASWNAGYGGVRFGYAPRDGVVIRSNEREYFDRDGHICDRV
jgi:hypothetical protein